MSSASPSETKERVRSVLQKYWGFDELRPLQEEAITAGIERRDSLVVLPTGGGKSLCYQVPPAVEGRTDIVVSPLIALMKDQVDGLRSCGYPAAALHSGVPPEAIRAIEQEMVAGKYRLIFVTPERLLTPRFLQLVEKAGIRTFAVDEAHCISHWGHDFRPEYRQLAGIRERFPGACLHAYTATATDRVRTDIVEQLRLASPKILVGTFDRPNLTYRVVPKVETKRQVLDVLARHPREAAIVYCLSRQDTQNLSAWLEARDVRVAHYHAGLSPEDRRRTQEAFSEERLDVIVATVAFGMGIDRSDVRCVIHAAIPKSVEHYQQETGRAGRDGLEAECVLLYSPADVMRLESLLRRNEDGDRTDERSAAEQTLLEAMRKFAMQLCCRHRALSEYFGQPYPKPACGACDFCLDEVEGVEDGTVVAQKILSCVARTGERFGAMHVVDVVVGAETARIRQWKHDALSTYGLLRDVPRKAVISMLHQLVDQGLLERTSGDRPVLRLNDRSWEVLRGHLAVRLRRPKEGKVAKTRFDVESWEGVDRGLFESLRELRRQLAEERNVPPYVIFADAALRDMARLRPTSAAGFAAIRGVGEKKLKDLGPPFLQRIRSYCEEKGRAEGSFPSA